MIWLLAAFAALLLLWMAWIEPRRLRIRHERAALPGLAVPVRAVVIADLQPIDLHWPPGRLRRAFARAAEARPDIALWLGDYHNAATGCSGRVADLHPALRRWHDRRLTPMRAIAAEMGRLTAPMGAYAVLGNHDWAWSGAETARLLRVHGIAPLIGEAALARHPETGAELWVLGYDDVSFGRDPRVAATEAGVPAGAPRVALTHSPDLWPRLDAPLALAGHTHGGQIRLPGLGALYVPVVEKGLDWGWFEREGRRLFVTCGLGTSPPWLRLLAPPEIVVLDLLPEAGETLVPPTVRPQV